MQHLKEIKGVDITTAVPLDKIKEQVLDARKHLLAPIHTCHDWREDRPIALIGGGPSLRDNLDELRKYKDTMVCGSAHDYIMEQGITPTYCIICDPDPIMVRYLTKLNQGTKYLIASQCHIDVFNHILGKVGKQGRILMPGAPWIPHTFIWHAASGKDFDDEVFPKDEFKVVGGCTVGTRAIGMAMMMGFRNIHLFGYDTCLTNDYKHHAYDFVDPEVETLGEITEIRIDPNGPKFKVAGYMLGQLFDFQYMLSEYSTRLNIKVIGGGLLAEFLRVARIKAIEEGKVNG
jgi:uncharacterized Rossmann fold enzyme